VKGVFSRVAVDWEGKNRVWILWETFRYHKDKAQNLKIYVEGVRSDLEELMNMLMRKTTLRVALLLLLLPLSVSAQNPAWEAMKTQNVLNFSFDCVEKAAFPKQALAAQRTSTAAQVTQPPEAVVREFYKWYIHNLAHRVNVLKQARARATLKKCVTAGFIREMERNQKLPMGEGFDADEFLLTQEFPSEPKDEARWIKAMSISKVEVNGDAARAIVSFEKEEVRVMVNLIREAGLWKISKVVDPESGEGFPERKPQK